MKSKKAAPILFALAGAGILLLVLSFFPGNGKSARAEQAQKEEEIAAFLEKGEGVGSVSVRLCFAEDGKTVTGAAVVCAGGGDPAVRAKIVRLLCAALGIGSNHIFVYESA